MSGKEESARDRLQRRVSVLGEAIEAGRTADEIRDVMKGLGLVAVSWRWPGMSSIYAGAIVDAWDRYREVSRGSGVWPDLATMEAARHFVAEGRAVLEATEADAAETAETAETETEAAPTPAPTAKERIAALRSATVDLASKFGTVSEATESLRGFCFDAIFFVPMSEKGWICDMRDTIDGRQTNGRGGTQASALIQAAARMIEEVRGDVKPTEAAAEAARPTLEEAVNSAWEVIRDLNARFLILEATECAVPGAPNPGADAIVEALRAVGLNLTLDEQSSGPGPYWRWEVRPADRSWLICGWSDYRDSAALEAARRIRARTKADLRRAFGDILGAKEDK